VAAAIDRAARYGAELVVLRAYGGRGPDRGAPRLPAGRTAGEPWAATEATAVERLLGAVEEQAAARGLACRTAMADGDPAEVLVSLAERHGADLLVVGNKGMDRRIRGSVPNTVTHTAHCSVLVVHTT
jgi:nucleotide-binding universal stress UspA family protein